MDDQDINRRKQSFVDEVARYVAKRRAGEAFTREALGALNSIARLQSQRQSLLDNVAHYYKQNIKADVAPGLLILITFLADNNDGACSMSKSRMARFLSRSGRAVQDAIQRLDADQTILVKERPGAPSLLTPWILKAFGEIRDPIAWIMDARAPKHGKGPGRPRKISSEEKGEKPPSPHFFDLQNQGDAKIQEDNFYPFSEKRGEDERQKGEKISAAYNTTRETTDVVVERASAPTEELLRKVFSETQLVAFNERFAGWGRSAYNVTPVDRSHPDQLLSAELMVATTRHPNCATNVIDAAALSALNTVMAITPRGANGGSSMITLFRRTLDSEIDRPKGRAAAPPDQRRTSPPRMSEYEVARLAFRQGGE